MNETVDWASDSYPSSSSGVLDEEKEVSMAGRRWKLEPHEVR